MNHKHDLLAIKHKVETIFKPDELHIWMRKDPVCGRSMNDDDMQYTADLLNAKPIVLHIVRNNKQGWFSIDLPEYKDQPVVCTDWDEFAIDTSFNLDDIIDLIKELLKCQTPCETYKVCIDRGLTDGYMDPVAEYIHPTRRDLIDKTMRSIDALCDIMITQQTSESLLPVFMISIASFIETIGRYYELCKGNKCPSQASWHTRGNSKKFWKRGLPIDINRQLTDINRQLPQSQQVDFYHNFRCGLVHAGELTGDLKIGTYINTNLSTKPYTINIVELWGKLKKRWTEILATPNMHPTGGSSTTVITSYGVDRNYSSKT